MMALMGMGDTFSRNFRKMNHSLKDRLIRHMEDGRYEPQSKSELTRALNVDSRQKLYFRALVDQMEEEGKLVRLQKGRYALKRERRNLVHGMIRILRSGKILFLPRKGDPAAAALGWDTEAIPELELKPNHLGNALDGDRVAVRVERKTAKGRRNIRRDRFSSLDAGMKARVEEVTERAHSRWLGVFRTGKNKLGRVLGDGVSSPSSIELAEKPAMEVLPGQLVSVEPVPCGEEKKAPRGKIVEVLGYPDEPHVDMEAVIRKYGLSTEFPASVLRELETLPQNPSPEELARREDWTDRTVITIDPASARDFDDAISITATPSGWTLAVHIADVSHFVRPGGALDGEALRRGNSTYLPDRVLPMLPPRLSDDLCSLRPDVVRLTKVCEMKFDQKGKMLRTRFADAFIRSKARLTYQEAFAMLKGNNKGEVPSTVREAWNLASILRRNRYAKGALDLDFPEVRAVMDKDGRVTGIITEEYDESHQLIEECMLAANEAVALALKNGNRPTIYRVHEEPDSSKLFEFGQLCKLYGHPVHDIGQRQYLNELMKSIKDSPDEQLLKLALLKSLMRARYDTEPLGHYGLATPNYCHFTSPIRRYADLVVHRSLNPLLSNPPKGAKGAGSAGRLEEDAEHISETERISASAEKDANRMKLFEWLEGQCYTDHPEVHEALVTETRHFGVLLEIPRLQIKGLVKPDKLPGGRWVYEAFASRWKNDHGSVLCAGLRVPVIPVKVDREQQWADFAIVSRKKPRQTEKTAFPAKQEKRTSGRGRRNR
ncbi:ribonuclease R family protein [Akkermansia muciniphila]|uniref:ribonuclease R family protein n=2 Tax=Akkermansia TaxID=239934 RepID=UPI0027D2D56C|nr:VacB/RNase II family 3'-5' exoribonuclease [Akkermansia muciniphila]WMB16207.1 VacB/RNase II family 3'-5' exoribonuclease [Akkermansia muciniphila]WMB20781.1 VacB/RNase II family 3'-5' exoribonuclease [Akkermansia muciniphila]